MMEMAITENTSKLLSSRQDDYRLALINDVMFSDDFSGSHPNREFTVANNKGEEETYHLRKADVYDTFTYDKVPNVENMKEIIESTVVNIKRMKENGASIPGMLPIKDVWVFLFTTDKNGENMCLNTYYNPDASDCSEIFKSERHIVLVGFCCICPVDKKKNTQYPEDCPDEFMKYSFMSPLDMANLDEYRRIAIEEECKMLENMFLIKFNPDSIQ